MTVDPEVPCQYACVPSCANTRLCVYEYGRVRVCVCVRARARTRWYACIRACVGANVKMWEEVCVRARACGCVWELAWVCVHACLRSVGGSVRACVRVCARMSYTKNGQFANENDQFIDRLLGKK